MRNRPAGKSDRIPGRNYSWSMIEGNPVPSDGADPVAAVPSIGRPLVRSEDRPLLRGSVAFTADVRHRSLDGAAYIAFVRSPLAAGTIERIDTTEADGKPGVIATLTGRDIDHLAPYALPIGDRFAQPLLPSRNIGFAGQALALVVAGSEAEAADAAEAVDVVLTPTEPVLDIGSITAPTTVGGITAPTTVGGSVRGDPEPMRLGGVIEPTRLEAAHDPSRFLADVVVELEQWSPRQLPAPIEARTVAAVELDGRLTVWAATQTPHAYRHNLATLFGVPEQSIRVIASAVGGGFGGKVSRTAEEYLVPLMARRLGRPVRWNETRSENFATATQGRGERITITIAGTTEGCIDALRATLIKDGGAYPLIGVMLPATYTAKVANGCYDIAHVEFNSMAVTTNKPPTSAYRGAGRSPYIGALERTIDHFSNAIGMDPAEVRRRNLIRPEQMPYPTPTGAVYDEADYPADLARALVAADYTGLRAEQERRRNAGDPSALGIGIACYNHMTTGGGGEAASVTVEADGRAVVVTGSTSQGQGHATTWAQIAADVLAIDVGSIRVVEGDTDAIDSGVGAVASRSLQTAGPAIHRAATEVVERARGLAAELLEAAPADVVLAADGSGFHVIGTPARTVQWGPVVSSDPASEITCGDFYDTEGRNTFPSGTHVAVVEVDTETGLVTLRRLVAVDDAGTVVNPEIVAGQLHGGIASAVGQVLGEVIHHDSAGNQVTGSLLDYPLPTADQLPSFELVRSATATSLNDLGWKGVGESGTVGATGAIHNAVVDALTHLGVEHLDLPCTPERVWRAIQRR